jgi:hypothetical protein
MGAIVLLGWQKGVEGVKRKGLESRKGVAPLFFVSVKGKGVRGANCWRETNDGKSFEELEELLGERP